MQVLPCGAIGVLLSMQKKVLHKLRGGSQIAYIRLTTMLSIRIVYSNQLHLRMGYPRGRVKGLS
jgi:hypothetical protein